MITYVILLLIAVTIAFFAYILFNKDILSPTVISSTMFGISILFATIGRASWNGIEEIDLITILIISFGLLSFLVGEFIARKSNIKVSIVKVKNRKGFIHQYKEEKRINIIILFFCIPFIIITTILLLSEIKKICAYYNFSSSSISELLAFYRTKTELFSSSLYDDGVGINFIVKQMKKICEVMNIFLVYMFIRKIMDNTLAKNMLETVLLILGIAVGLFQTLLNSGGRSIMMHFFVSYIVLYLLLLTKDKSKKSSKISRNTKIRILMLIIIILILFYNMLPIIGRTSNSNFVEYVTFYLGTPIPSLSYYVENTVESNPQFASETFRGVYYILNKFDIIHYNKPLTHEWIIFSPEFASNVYTSMRAYYYDFGFFGILILQYIFGFIYTKFYLIAKKSKTNLSTIIYSFYFYVLIDQIRDEQFYSLINTSNIAILFIFVVLYRIIVCDSIRKGIMGNVEEINE